MIRTNIFLPEQLYQEIKALALEEGLKPAEKIRELLRIGLKKSGRVEPLFSEMLRNIQYDGKYSRDLSINHDRYLYK